MFDIIEMSRLQFALTAMYHFIFVPLTLGMAFLLAIMETVYVVTGKQIFKDMTKFWGKLFGINFAVGVATGLTMEFQFGTNWSYYSHYVGDIFGAPLAIEALMAFFLESTFVGLFFFGWDRLSKGKHLMVTWLVAVGSNLSALWILVANGWMQNPIGSEFNYETMRMEMVSFSELVLNPIAQAKFWHTTFAGYVTGAFFVMGISAYYLLKKRDLAFAKRSFGIAAVFGFIVSFTVIIAGDELGYQIGRVQKSKLAAIEAEWNTVKAPADFVMVGLPNQKEMRNEYAIEIPYLMGIIATRSMSTPVTGIKDLKAENEVRIRKGIQAYDALMKIKAGNNDTEIRDIFEKEKKNLGYAFLLEQYTNQTGTTVPQATEAQIQAAVEHTIPYVAPLFWSFRLMVGVGFILLIGSGIAMWATIKNKIGKSRWLSWLLLLSIPLPWLACEMGWFIAEYGRQPWAIYEILPTSAAHSALTVGEVLFTMVLICGLYSLFLVVEMFLMFKFARLGPSSLKTGRYHFETTTDLTQNRE